MDLTKIKTAPPAAMADDLRTAERKCRDAGVNAACRATARLGAGEYEEALLAAQELYASIIKASDAAQIVARYFPAERPADCAADGGEPK